MRKIDLILIWALQGEFYLIYSKTFITQVHANSNGKTEKWLLAKLPDLDCAV